jgi:hypothetical protein
MNIEGNTTSEIGNKLSVKRVHQFRSCSWHVKLATLVRQGTTEIDNSRRRRAMRTTTPGINAAFTRLSGTLQLSCIVLTVLSVIQQFEFIRTEVGNTAQVVTNMDRKFTKGISKPGFD